MRDSANTSDELLAELQAARRKIAFLESRSATTGHAGELRMDTLCCSRIPSTDSATIDFKDLFDISKLQRLQDEFATATGVASIITYPDGTPITNPSNFCRLCSDLIRKTEKGCENCRMSDASIGRHCATGPIIEHCKSGGLWDAGAGITVGGQHVACWLIGQVRDETQTEESIRAYARQIGAEEDEVAKAFGEVPKMSLERFQNLAQVLFTLANQLSAMAHQNLRQARLIADLERTEKELKESTARINRITDAAQDAIIMMDPDGRISFWNLAAERILGYSREQALGMELHEILAPERYQQEARAAVHRFRSASQGGVLGRTVELAAKRKDGAELDVSLSLSGLEIEGRWHAVGIMRDITSRKQSDRELADAKAMLDATFEQNPVPMVLVTMPGGVVTIANKASKDFLGVEDGSEYLGRSLLDIDRKWAEYDPQGRLVSVTDLPLSRAMAGETTKNELLRIQCADGATRWELVSAAPIFGRDGRMIGAFTTFPDITDRVHAEEAIKESLKEKEVLLREVHHRVKNNLQIISSLLSLQENSLDNPAALDALASSRGRVASMALIHEQLYRSRDLSGVGLDEYLRQFLPRLVSTYASGRSISLVLEPSTIALCLDQAIPLGLIINELVTNSLKHAFKDTGQGCIRVVATLHDGTVSLLVADDGTGLPVDYEARKDQSLGLQIVTMLARQLRGKLATDICEGTTFRLSFPLSVRPA
ncbi:MAG: PocR ligand-binding domain-containing protein [Desulfovibrio sp.]|nr:PocR ligand-binding domain-containing protein [Desulfovibrio sp.]MBI4961250.1 PocR ligand-binding domain-containing protein [Desulfovibrio sp.]